MERPNVFENDAAAAESGRRMDAHLHPEPRFSGPMGMYSAPGEGKTLSTTRHTRKEMVFDSEEAARRMSRHISGDRPPEPPASPPSYAATASARHAVKVRALQDKRAVDRDDRKRRNKERARAQRRNR